MLKSFVRNWVNSPYLDLFGAALVLAVTFLMNYHTTLYVSGEIISAPDWQTFWDKTFQGAFPIGAFSVVGSILSLLSTRWIGNQKNLGNIIGVMQSVNSGVIDYLLGNKSAILTYPFSFVLNSLAVYKWQKGQKIKVKDTTYYVVNMVGLVLGYFLVYLGFLWFDENGADLSSWLFHSIAITFGISLGANFSVAMKYEETYISWFIYNIFNLLKNILLGNFANVGKYTFYLINSVFTYFDWRLNGDRPQQLKS